MHDILSEIVPCDVCGEKFDIEQEGIDIDDEFFCGNCQGERTFNCLVCGEYELEDRRGDIGSVLIVNDSEEARLLDGIYEIVKHPYYGGPIIGDMEIFECAIRRLGDLPTGKNSIDTDGYACGHICRYCDPVVKRRTILFRKFGPASDGGLKARLVE